MNPICFYHSADLDGKCSAAIVQHFEQHARNREVELYGIDYGKPFPWDKISKERDVYMVDFSLKPFTDMHRLGRECALLTWIDHHRTALEEWALLEMEADDRGAGRQLCSASNCEVGKSGCELTWEYTHGPEAKVPLAVQLLGRYDVWDESGKVFPWEQILAFQYGMRVKETEPDSALWCALLEDEGATNLVAAITTIGHVILAYETKQNEIGISACGFEVQFEGLRALAANRGPTNSKLFDSKWNPDKHDIMISFYYSHRGLWKVSLYTTKEGIDCAALCKHHGGGGHAKAAGFQCEVLPFAKWINRERMSDL